MQIYRTIRRGLRGPDRAPFVLYLHTEANADYRTNALLPSLKQRRRLINQLMVPDEERARINAVARASRRRIASSSAALALTLAVAPLLPAANIAALVLLLYAAQYPFRKALAGLQQNNPNGYLLTSLSFALLIATGAYPVAAMIQLLANTSILTTARVKGETSARIVEMFRQHPRMVQVLRDEQVVGVPFEALAAGDYVLVVTGDVIPADGRVMTGTALVDQQALTGEAHPVSVGEDDMVYALTTVASGQIVILVEHAGDETLVAQIGDILNQSLAAKAGAELWVERAVNASIVPSIALGAALLPVAGLGATTAFFVAHPKMKGAILVSISALNHFYMFADQRILVKDARALDYLQQVDTLVFDKTGTLTTNALEVSAVHRFGAYSEAEILSVAASAEQHQHHPIADAILAAARAQAVPLVAVDDVEYITGMGLTSQTAAQRIHIGSERYMQHMGLLMPAARNGLQDAMHDPGNSLVYVALDAVVVGAIELEARLRPEVPAVLEALHELGIHDLLILSGDRESATRQLAQTLGIDEYYAEMLPQEKAALIDTLIAEGRTVCYVGDGINDAIAMSKAQVSVSLAGASNVAMDTARIVLMDAHLRQLPFLLEAGRRYRRNTVEILGVVAGTGAAAMTLAVWPVGLAAAIAANAVGFAGGLAFALRPLRDYRQQQAQAMPALPLDSEGQRAD